MPKKWITETLPQTASIDHARFQVFLDTTKAKNLQQLSETLSADTSIDSWIKELITLEIAHQRALEAKKITEAPTWFASTTADGLGLMALKIAPDIDLYYFDHDVLSWYEADTKTTTPKAQPSFVAAGKTLRHLTEAQYQLLEAICQSSMLGDAFDKWVREHPALAAENGTHVGEWLRDWILEGVLIR